MIIGFGISPSRVKVTGGAAAFDADAQAFFTAASITDSTQKSAVNQLVLDLKSYNIWTKMTALYPICGGSASSHAVNLKTPGTYNLTFSTGWSHASTGATPNGAAYASTGIILSSVITNKPHISYYSRSNTNTGLDQIDIGVRQSTNICYLSCWYNASGLTNVIARNTSSTVLLDGGTTTDSRGFYQTNKISNTAKLYKNSSTLDTKTDTGSIPSTYGVTIGAYNNEGSIQFYTNRQCAFSSIGDGLDDTESSNFYTAVQAYQTTLSRNV